MNRSTMIVPGLFVGVAALMASFGAAFQPGGASTTPPASPPRQAEPNTASSTIPAGRTDKAWIDKHEAILADARKGGWAVAFVGDSITEGWKSAGKTVWESSIAPHKALNCGIGGDRTQHVLYRLDHGVLSALKQTEPASPVKTVVLMIGTNNTAKPANTGEEIAAGVQAAVQRLRTALPETKIVLMAILPRGERPNPQREVIADANRRIEKLADGKLVVWLDIGPQFLDKDGAIPKELMPDYLHLSEAGYRKWADALAPMLTDK